MYANGGTKMAHYPDYKLEDIEMQEGKLDLTPVIDAAPADLTKSQRKSVASIVRHHSRTRDCYVVENVRWADGYRGRYYLSMKVVIEDAWFEEDPKKYKMGAIFYDTYHYRLGIRGKLEAMDGSTGKWTTDKLYLKSNAKPESR